MPTASFLESFVTWSRVRPLAPALRWGERSVTYRELAEEVRRLREWVAAGPLPPGGPVCVLARKSPKAIALVLACLGEGHRVLLPPRDLGRSTVDELSARSACGHVIETDGAELWVRAVPGGHEGAAEPGLLLTTSGSTGVPKIVPLSTGGVDRFLAWARTRFGLGPGGTTLSYAPLNFDLSLLDVWASLSAGGAVELVDADQAIDGRHLRSVLERGEITVVQAVPLCYRLLADAVAPGTGFPSVRHVIFTGEAMPERLLARTRSLFPAATSYNLYGCTETNDSFLYEVPPGDPPGPLPIGHPIAGVETRIVAGELWVSTPFQAEGYLDPGLTGDRWVTAPDGTRFFRTGDLVHRDERGRVVLTGRADFQVKVRGVRTSLPEVERVIEAHPDVAEAVVLAVPDDLAGHRLHAVVRPTPDSGLHSLELRRHCAAHLARTAIPDHIDLVGTPLPRTSTGKVDRSRLLPTAQGRT
ncbi:AMP-binding protein [Allokutzneria oryzae]|uniref:AMP-binding protein n=1 Tax=Allokutzneria oryzae TaxID=1378989 RepID=A0ABV6A713_9PSEU